MRRDPLRIVLVAVVLSSGVGLAVSPGAPNVDAINDRDRPLGELVGERVAPPSTGTTVIATQGAAHRNFSADLLAIGPSGELVYHNGTHDVYFDVDPHPSGSNDVLVVGSTDRADSTVNHIEVHNLSTGEVRELYSGVTPNVGHSRWHDVDRINETHYVVAGIEADRVFVVDVESDRIVWQWNASDHFPPSSGGPPDDWTHLNDVEVLDDGRIMVSLRNQDQVVFLTRDGDVDEPWTLGADDDHDTLYEQHNPDYVPEENGGPAVLVAGSENDRVVEYQRRDGEWERSWEWSDDRLDWPRDADRFPNGDTLITDSLGHRVLEVGPDGSVLWSVPVGFPYEAERLGTGDESAGGPSAASADLASGGAGGELVDVVPSKLRHGLVWVTPAALTPLRLALVVVLGVALGLLGALELRDRLGDGGGAPA